MESNLEGEGKNKEQMGQAESTMERVREGDINRERGGETRLREQGEINRETEKQRDLLAK